MIIIGVNHKTIHFNNGEKEWILKCNIGVPLEKDDGQKDVR